MHRSTLLALFAALLTSVVAQQASVNGLPTCAQGCISNYGGCSALDVKCICSNKPLLTNLSCCVSQKCDSQGQADVIKFADALCAGAGVNDLPRTASCAPGATAGSSASTSSTAMSSGATTSSGASSTASTATATSSAASSSAAAQTSGSAAVGGKSYRPESLGWGLGLLGFLAAL